MLFTFPWDVKYLTFLGVGDAPRGVSRPNTDWRAAGTAGALVVPTRRKGMIDMSKLSLFTATVALATGFAGAAAADITPLVTPDWLAAELGDEDLVVLDIRNRIDGGSAETFAAGHIPGAVYSNYIDAGWRVEQDGITGMLPPVADLEALIGGLGIDNDDHVVIVHGGTNGGSDFGSATRIYWTFKVLGHDAVSILDGGYAAWAATDGPVATGTVAPEPATFTADFQDALLVDTEEVATAIGDGRTQLLDARPVAQYLGLEKAGPVARAGTLPGAVNVPNTDLVTPEAFSADSETVRQLLAEVGLSTDNPQIAFCNTGHWASVGWFALSEIGGFTDVALYDGSMTAWTLDDSRPVQTNQGETAAQ